MLGLSKGGKAFVPKSVDSFVFFQTRARRTAHGSLVFGPVQPETRKWPNLKLLAD
jgi:hypothetical protein